MGKWLARFGKKYFLGDKRPSVESVKDVADNSKREPSQVKREPGCKDKGGPL